MVQLAAWSWPGSRAHLAPISAAARLSIASAYHAPVAGVVFVLELALGFFARHTVAPVLIASKARPARWCT